jgi:hypothetical protein
MTVTHAGRRAVGLAVAVLVAAVGLGGLSVAPSTAADSATIHLVQGLPGKTVNWAVDGRTVATDQKSGSISAPQRIDSGKRRVTVTSAGTTIVDRMVTVGAGWNADVVVHLPAKADRAPLLTTYKNDLSGVPKDKASLTVAHTAAVPPADVTVDGTVLFSDIGNGESLHLVVPVATYRVAIVPTGKSKPVYFGPVDLTVQGGSLNAVYAVGNPAAKTMSVIVHVLDVKDVGSRRPRSVDTGTGGQAVGTPITVLPSLTR